MDDILHLIGSLDSEARLLSQVEIAGFIECVGDIIGDVIISPIFEVDEGALFSFPFIPQQNIEVIEIIVAEFDLLFTWLENSRKP